MDDLYSRYGEFELASLEETVQLPYVLKDKLLIGPGVHNGLEYTGDVLEKIYSNTDFAGQSKDLFYDHLDMNKGGGARTWIGDIKNFMFKDGGVYGDLYVVNKQAAMNLEYGAKFGVSAKVAGTRDHMTQQIVDGAFINWSLVYTPADKNTYLNSVNWSTFLNFEEVKMSEDKETKNGIEYATKEDVQKLQENISKIAAILEEQATEPVPEKPAEEKPAEPAAVPEEKPEEVPPVVPAPAPVEEKKELSSTELDALFDTDEARAFVKAYLSKNPAHGLLEAADAWDLQGKDIVRDKNITSLEKKVDELQLKLTPERKTVKDANSERSTEDVVATLSDEQVDEGFFTHVMLPSSKKY